MSNDQVAIDAVSKLFEFTDAVEQLFYVLNQDLDGDYFICQEAEPIVQKLRDLIS